MIAGTPGTLNFFLLQQTGQKPILMPGAIPELMLLTSDVGTGFNDAFQSV